jgi:dipeptidyl aminopeptidase/acylaminoacyl peptidase
MSRTMHRVLGMMLALLALLTAPAAAAPASDLQAALALPRASELVAAAETDRFAWVVIEAGVRTIWIGGPREPARAVWSSGSDDGITVTQLALRHDGSQLVFVRGGDGDWADDRLPNPGALAQPPRQQVLLLDLGGGAPQVIGEGHSPAFAPDGSLAFTRRSAILRWHAGGPPQAIAEVVGAVENLRFSHDGKRLLFIEDRDSHAYAAVIDLGRPEVRYLAPGLSIATDPVFSPDGREVALIRYREPPPGSEGKDGEASYWTIDVADAATGEARTVWRAPRGKGGRYAGTRQQNLYWTADNRLLFPWERNGWLHVYAIPVDGRAAAEELTPGEFEVETFTLDADRKSLLFVANAEEPDRHELWRTVAGQAARRVSREPAIQSNPAVAQRAVAVIASDEQRPAHVALVSGPTLGPVGVLERAVTPRSITYRAADGMLVRGQLFQGVGKGPRPAVVFLHGGPRRQMLTGYHPSGYYSNAYAMNQHLAAKGFTVLAVNYRSGTGYGLAFRDAPEIAREGASEYGDVIAGGKWLAAQPGVDPQRIGVWGGSWGGYLAALALARDSGTFKAGADLHGVHSMQRTTSETLSPASQIAERQLQWDSSPLAAIETWRSPVLLIHGDDDRNVPFRQSLLLARELAARGIPFEELVFPNERHTFLRHARWVEALGASADFLARHLAAELK